MSIFNGNATAGKSTEIPSEGNHPGALIALIDLGTHVETYKDGKSNESHKIFLIFELNERSEGMTQNHVIGKEVTLTFSPQSTYRKILEGLRGKSYGDGEEIAGTNAVGKSGLVNIKHGVSKNSGNTFAKFENITPLPRGMPQFKPTLPLTTWFIGCDKPFPEYAWLPYSFLNGQLCPLKQIMEASKEMKGGNSQQPRKSGQSNGTQQQTTVPTSQEAEDDRIPF